jgi:vacuolar-type H+-ATPase subunit I/STV1
MEKDHLEIILDDINSKFDIVIEGHTALDRKIDRKFDELNEKIDFVNFKIDTVNEHLSQKIDAVATDLKAHRNDTEAHQIYKVKEG